MNPVAKLEPGSIDACIGHYETEGKMGVDVSRNGDRILMKRGRGEPVEIEPVSATEFFQRGTFVRVTFEKDAAGTAQRATISDWGSTTKAARAEQPAPPKQ